MKKVNIYKKKKCPAYGGLLLWLMDGWICLSDQGVIVISWMNEKTMGMLSLFRIVTSWLSSGTADVTLPGTW